MSTRAVLLLLFFIAGLILAEPFITQGFTAQHNRFSLYGGLGDSLTASNMTVLSQTSGISEKNQIIEVPLTAYSSSVDETDDTPFITASGNYVRDGVAAANFLPIGTKFKIPKIYGDKVFVVEDRMHRSYNYRIDLWFPSKEEAMMFGLRTAEVEIF
jgi:3D (Asp-Asp-Asp) domain-containing protein